MSEPIADSLFDALSVAHRRRILFNLVDQSPQRIGKSAGIPEETRETDEESVLNRHAHLPKLVDYGFIEWDRERQMVMKGPRFETIEPVVELLNDNKSELPLMCVKLPPESGSQRASSWLG